MSEIYPALRSPAQRFAYTKCNTIISFTNRPIDTDIYSFVWEHPKTYSCTHAWQEILRSDIRKFRHGTCNACKGHHTPALIKIPAVFSLQGVHLVVAVFPL